MKSEGAGAGQLGDARCSRSHDAPWRFQPLNACPPPHGRDREEWCLVIWPWRALHSRDQAGRRGLGAQWNLEARGFHGGQCAQCFPCVPMAKKKRKSPRFFRQRLPAECVVLSRDHIRVGGRMAPHPTTVLYGRH